MKLQENDIVVERSGDFTEASFGIRSEGMPFVISILRDKIYSNKVLAVVREVVSNAADSTVESKTDKPIIIHAANFLEPFFSVRDFGAGLSHKEMVDIYINYGTSTKRESNDYIGQLGLGAKSPLCLSDSFTVISYNGGKKISYTCYIDETNIGKLAKLGEEDTNETGLEVIVPVNNNQYNEFRNNIFQVCKHLKQKFTVTGIPEEEIPSFERNSEFCGNDWCIVGGNSVAISGGVAYKIDSYALNDKLSDDEMGVIDCGCELEFPLGSISVSASRESLEYNAATVSSIKKMCQKVLFEVEKVVTDKLSACPNLIAAKQFYNKNVYSGSIHGLRNLLKNLKWRDKDVNDWNINVLEIVQDNSITCTCWELGGRYKTTLKKTEVCYIHCLNDALICYNDTGSDRVKNRIRTIFATSEDTPRYVYLLNFIDNNAQKTFFDYVETNELVKLSSYAETKLTYARNNSAASGIQTFTLNENRLSDYMRWSSLYRYERRRRSKPSKGGVWDEDNEIDLNEGGIYVILNHFEPEAGAAGLSELYNILRNIRSLGIKDEIYGIRKKTSKNLGSEWVLFKDWARKTFEDYLKANNVEDKMAHQQEIVDHSGDIANKFARYKDKVGGLIAEYLNIFETYKKEDLPSEAIGELCRIFGIELKTTEKNQELTKLDKKINKKYPLLEYIRWHDAEMNKVIQYAQGVDCLEEVEKAKE